MGQERTLRRCQKATKPCTHPIAPIHLCEWCEGLAGRALPPKTDHNVRFVPTPVAIASTVLDPGLSAHQRASLGDGRLFEIAHFAESEQFCSDPATEPT
jgi:hypothetical protein